MVVLGSLRLHGGAWQSPPAWWCSAVSACMAHGGAWQSPPACPEQHASDARGMLAHLSRVRPIRRRVALHAHTHTHTHAQALRARASVDLAGASQPAQADKGVAYKMEGDGAGGRQLQGACCSALHARAHTHTATSPCRSGMCPPERQTR